MIFPTLCPARPDDKGAITALAAKIWEGEDYLAYNFDEWVAQERGRFVVAYSGEELVGCNKLTEFRPGEWWMEGLRGLWEDSWKWYEIRQTFPKTTWEIDYDLEIWVFERPIG